MLHVLEFKVSDPVPDLSGLMNCFSRRSMKPIEDWKAETADDADSDASWMRLSRNEVVDTTTTQSTKRSIAF